jgi:hypothetical protein
VCHPKQEEGKIIQENERLKLHTKLSATFRLVQHRPARAGLESLGS